MKLLPVLLLLFSSAARAGSAPLEPAVAADLAAKNSPAALAAEQDIIIARQRLREARFNWLPQFTLSASANRLNLEYPSVLPPELGERYLDPLSGRGFYTVRLSALQPLYTGGRNANMLKLARAAHSQAKVNFDMARADAALEAKKAYFGLLYRRRLAEAEKRWLERAGAAAAGGGLEAKALLAAQAAQAREAELAAETAASALQKALNGEPGSVPLPAEAFEPVPVAETPSACLVTAMESRPDLKSEVYRAQMDDIAVNLALTRRRPTVYVGGSYDMGAGNVSGLGDPERRSDNWLASLAVHFPLSYDVWTQVQQRRAQQRQGELRRAELQDKARFEILAAHREASFWLEESRRRADELARLQADLEKEPSASPRAVLALAALERGRLEAVHNQLVARSRLEWAQGRDLARR